MTKYIDYLTEDEQIPGQNFVCLSFVSPDIKKIKNCTLRGIKIRGVFNKKEDAEKHAESLRKKDPDFDIFVGEVGKWLPWDPTPEQVEDERWQEKELNNIVANYKKAREESKVLFEERKQEMMKKMKVNNDEEQKLTKIIENDDDKEDNVLDIINKIKEKEKELQDKNTKINETEKKLNEINKELNEISNLTI